MEPESVPSTAPNPEGQDSPSGDEGKWVMSEAQSVLDNLRDVVMAERERILESAQRERERIIFEAQTEARAEAARIRVEAGTGRDLILTEARRKAMEMDDAARRAADRQRESVRQVIQEAIDQLSHIESLRTRLAAIAEPKDDGGANDAPEHDDYAEVDPRVLRKLASVLGESACRDVIDTFLSEVVIGLGDLRAALESQEDESRAISRTLLTLASGCATVGAYEVARVCRSYTAASLAEHIDELEARLRVVRSEIARLRDSGTLSIPPQ